MERVLIFGAAGFVGSYLAKEFAGHGYEVYASDRNKTEKLPCFADCREADLLSKNEVAALVDELSPDIIVNLAAISSVGVSWQQPQATMEVNVVGALNILEAARKLAKLPKIMFVGSSEEYAPSDEPLNENSKLAANNPYGISKMAQERFAAIYRERYGMKIYCVRPFNHTGVGQKVTFALPSFCKQVAEIEKSAKPGTIKVGNLSAQRDFSDVRDVVRAYRVILESEDCRKIFNVGSGKAYSLQELLEYIISLSSQAIKVEVEPERFRPVDNPLICCDNAYIKRELGWEPRYEIKETLSEIFRSYL